MDEQGWLLRVETILKNYPPQSHCFHFLPTCAPSGVLLSLLYMNSFLPCSLGLSGAELTLESPELSTLPKPRSSRWPGGTRRDEVRSWKGWELRACDQESCFARGLLLIWTGALQGDRVFISNFRNNTTCISEGVDLTQDLYDGTQVEQESHGDHCLL